MSTIEFNQQLEGLQSYLVNLSRKYTKTQDDSLDLVQDTLLRAMSYKDKFRENTNLKGWLFTIMRNTFINQYRKKKKANTYTDSSESGFYLNQKDTYTFNRPHKNLEYQEVWEKTNEIREDLIIPFKMYLTGYKYNEIAEHLNIPLGTVKNRIFHARKELQNKLVGYAN
ncbi:MAG: RNA polymerase sigma factor [Flammeovirgaceae bacterium]|nr:RNA polymerase sigma factor [Flammeovirgaceae bacterium]